MATVTYRLRLAAALSIGGLAFAAGAADAAPVAGWSFSEVEPDAPLGAGQAIGSPALWTSARGTRLRVVDTEHGHALDVDAWRTLSPGQKVDPTATALSTDPAFADGKPWGRDGGTDVFDPGTGDFVVGLWARPTNASAYPRGSKSVGSVSPNLVQKGRANDTGGFWKVTLQLVRTADGFGWAPECVLKGRDGSKSVANGAHALVLDDDAWVHISCVRSGPRYSLVLTDGTGVERIATQTNAGGIDADNALAVAVGHKVGARNAGDAYDGLLTDLVIDKG